MKKLIPTLAAGALVLVACSQNKYTVEYSTPSDLKGDTVVIVDPMTGDTIVSAIAGDSTVVFSGTIEQPRLGYIVAGGYPMAQVVIEPGNITFDSKSGLPQGTKFNDAYKDYVMQAVEKTETLRPKLAEEQSRDSVFQNVFIPDAVKFIQDNSGSPYNVLIFGTLADYMDVKALKSCAEADTVIGNNPDTQRMIKVAEAKLATGTGADFIDVEVPQADGSTVKLSDYVKPGKYTIVDFWASWCGPCRNEIPTLISLYNKYKNAGLEVVGVAVWDQPEETAKTVEEFKIPYPIVKGVKDNTSVTDTYGVMAIPTIIVIDPQGKIVARDLRGEALAAKMAQLLGK